MKSFISQLLAYRSSFISELKFKTVADEHLCLHAILPILLLFFYPLQAQAVTARLVPQPDSNFTVEQIAQGLGVP